MQNSCLKTSAWWSRSSHFVENGYPSLRFPNMVKMNIHEHWTRVTCFNPLWVSGLLPHPDLLSYGIFPSLLGLLSPLCPSSHLPHQYLTSPFLSLSHPLTHGNYFRATRGAITHARHACSQHSFGLLLFVKSSRKIGSKQRVSSNLPEGRAAKRDGKATW